MPRTTITLEAEVYRLTRRYAAERSLRLSGAISELIRRGLSARTPVREENGFVLFDLPADSPQVTLEDVQRALED